MYVVVKPSLPCSYTLHQQLGGFVKREDCWWLKALAGFPIAAYVTCNCGTTIQHKKLPAITLWDNLEIRVGRAVIHCNKLHVWSIFKSVIYWIWNMILLAYCIQVVGKPWGCLVKLLGFLIWKERTSVFASRQIFECMPFSLRFFQCFSLQAAIGFYSFLYLLKLAVVVVWSITVSVLVLSLLWYSGKADWYERPALDLFTTMQTWCSRWWDRWNNSSKSDFHVVKTWMKKTATNNYFQSGFTWWLIFFFFYNESFCQWNVRK